MKILARCAAALLAGLAFSGVWAQEATREADTYANKSSGPIVILPPDYGDVDDELDGTLYFPGLEYRSGDGWWSLACGDDGRTCQLLPARLDVAAHPHPQHDEPDVPGQRLRFTPAPDGSLLFFKPFRAPADTLVFEAGAVETWRIARSTRTPGTMEGELALADGRLLRFVPTAQGYGSVALELILDGKRQTLGFFPAGEYPIALERYVSWIGDLDRDGKPDFIVRFSYGFSNGDGNCGQGPDFALFLSSLAKPGEIVGLAGSFSYLPIDDAAGC
ncbi:MAG: hypothetical protein LBO79_00190 [Zoogloeaceae bacterium]|jgi:hypothetical protein|nr:hypothetical protein [Zoogloeaceae bacterium]